MRQIWDADHSVMHEKWVSEYGNTMKYKIFLGMSRLFTMDLKAINHVLMNNEVYQRPEVSRFFMSRVLGNGILVVEGTKHKDQRRIMNPAFGPSQIRELTEIFVEKALELRDVWATEIKDQSQEDVRRGRINVILGLSKMTLDVIGLAGFDYKFNSLQGEKNELNEAFRTLLNFRPVTSAMMIVRGLMGNFKLALPIESDRAGVEARETMERIGRKLLSDSKAALAKEGKDERFRRRDLLSLLLKANTSTDVPESQRMTEQDVIAQVPTFLVAGHETTSNGTMWALYALSLRPDIQTKLREELFRIPTDNPSMDELNSLPYLEAVIRETLRVHSPIPSTLRVAIKDDVVPLEKPFVDSKGRVRDTIQVRKGQTIFIPTLAINRSTEIWGEDAKEFRPERWESIPEGASSVPGVWGNILTFLGGTRACIGYRFALVEMKALIFTLVRTFEFRLAVPVNDIGKKNFIVQRPVLISDPKGGNQMPLLVTPYVHAD